VTVHEYGRGKVYFVGAYLDEAAPDALLGMILQEAGLPPVLETPAGADGQEVFVLVNHANLPQTFELPGQARDHLSGKILSTLALQPYGAAVITRIVQNPRREKP
jgi:beta-galactosidase